MRHTNQSQPLNEFPADAIFSVGHSTRSIEDFIALLKTYGIEALADIRTIPRSRRNPQFNDDALADALGGKEITYVPMKELGGLRRPVKNSLNAGWKNEGFRGFADYMQTEDFARALESLALLGRRMRTAMMCAEAVPWRCHRSLVADALTVRGIPVFEIFKETSVLPHALTAFAVAKDGRLTYPPVQNSLTFT